MTIDQLAEKARDISRQLLLDRIIGYKEAESYQKEIQICLADYRRTQLNELINMLGQKLPVLNERITL